MLWSSGVREPQGFTPQKTVTSARLFARESPRLARYVTLNFTAVCVSIFVAVLETFTEDFAILLCHPSPESQAANHVPHHDPQNHVEAGDSQCGQASGKQSVPVCGFWR